MVIFVVKPAPQVVLVNGAFYCLATLKWIMSAGYAKYEIYIAMVTARIFSHGAVIALNNCNCDCNSHIYNVGPPR